MAWLKGKKTVIGSLAISLLSAIYFLDILSDQTATWLTDAQYLAAAGFIGGLTGVAMRLGIGKK